MVTKKYKMVQWVENILERMITLNYYIVTE